MLKVGDKVVINSDFIKGREGIILSIDNDVSPYLVKFDEYRCRFQEKDLEIPQRGIVLHNINLTGYTLVQQLAKVQEEDDEFLTEIIKCNRKEAIAEYWDKVQAGLGALKMIGVSEEEVMEGYQDHWNKMISRGLKPRVKGDK